jgi:hypothetical protein
VFWGSSVLGEQCSGGALGEHWGSTGGALGEHWGSTVSNTLLMQCFERNFVATVTKGKIGVSHNSLIHWYICTLHAYVTSLTLACSTVSTNFPWGS